MMKNLIFNYNIIYTSKKIIFYSIMNWRMENNILNIKNIGMLIILISFMKGNFDFLIKLIYYY